MIADPCLFEFLETNASQALMRQPQVLEHIIFESIKIKADIVAQDEREQGARRKLNLGHTFAHAIERASGLPHGNAVSIGLCIASRIAQQMGAMQAAETARVERLLQTLTLPVRTDIAMPQLTTAMRRDKKKEGSSIHFVLPCGIGRCEVRTMPFEELEEACRSVKLC